MNGYTDLTQNIESSRNSLRRIARHDDQEFSKESIMNVMEKFVKTVNAMDETILVPCRLMDLQVGDATDTVTVQKLSKHQMRTSKRNKISIQESLNSSDLFNLYNMLNSVKVSLLWGKNHGDEMMEEECGEKMETTSIASSTSSSTLASQQQTTVSELENESSSGKDQQKGHIRRPSTVSMASSNSASTLSDSESEISNENDSGIESEGKSDKDKSIQLAKQCRAHLHGLQRCLEQMTDAAIYLTARYQSDVGPV